MMKIVWPGPLVVSPFVSQVLNGMRALAALLVLFSHARSLFFVDYAQVEDPNVAIKALYLLTGLGHEAVIIFFVLSGLLVGMSVLRTHQRNAWSWPDYLLQRLSRLWVVLVPALGLTWAWDRLGIGLFGPKSVYTGLPSDQFILNFPAAERLTAPIFVANLLFLQPTHFPTFGSNGPLWSLAFEWWYYLAFPCLLRAVVAPQARARWLHALGLLCIALVAGREIAASFYLWLLGVSVLFLPRLWRNYRPTAPLWSLLSAALLAAALVGSAARGDYAFTVLIGLSCAALVYFVLRLPSAVPMEHPTPQPGLATASESAPRPSFIKRMADFSYSLYLLHLPPLVFVHGWLWHQGQMKWQPTAPALLRGALLCFLVVAYAYLLSLITEAHTDKIRRWVKKTYLSPRPVTSRTV